MCKMAEIQCTRCVQQKNVLVVIFIAEYHRKWVCCFLPPPFSLSRTEPEMEKETKVLMKLKKRTKEQQKRGVDFRNVDLLDFALKN